MITQNPLLKFEPATGCEKVNEPLGLDGNKLMILFKKVVSSFIDIRLVQVFFLYLLLCLAPVAQATDTQVVQVVNNEVAPYIYRENGQFKGPYYEQLEKLFEQTDLDFELQLMPWPRVYKTLLQQPDTMVVSIGRTPKREDLFNWIGSISQQSTEMYYYQLAKNNFELSQLTTSGPYIIGVLRDTYYEEFVEQQQFDKDYYYAVLGGTELVQMLLKERVDLIILSEEHMQQQVKVLGLDIANLEKVGFAFSVSHYMAFSKDTAQPLLEKIRQAYAELDLQN